MKDQEVAEKLCPYNYVLCKRPVVAQDYFETFNRPNVTLVPITGSKSEKGKGSEVGIRRLTKKGVVTADGKEYEVDTIVFAIGYDAMTGAILNIDVTGTGGRKLTDHWKDGPRSYMGLQMAGFPNLFTITGPGSPSVFTNMLPTIEQHSGWVVNTLVHMRSNNFTRCATDQGAEDGWMQHAKDVTVGVRGKSGCSSWYTGDNVPGKPRVLSPYAGGNDQYLRRLTEMTEKGYEGFAMS